MSKPKKNSTRKNYESSNTQTFRIFKNTPVDINKLVVQTKPKLVRSSNSNNLLLSDVVSESKKLSPISVSQKKSILTRISSMFSRKLGGWKYSKHKSKNKTKKGKSLSRSYTPLI